MGLVDVRSAAEFDAAVAAAPAAVVHFWVRDSSALLRGARAGARRRGVGHGGTAAAWRAPLCLFPERVPGGTRGTCSAHVSLHVFLCVCLDVTTTHLVVLTLVLTYNSYVLIYDYNIMVTMDGVLRRLIYVNQF